MSQDSMLSADAPLSLWKHDLSFATPRQRFNRIISRVAEKHQISVADLLGPSPARRFSHPRQEAMAEVKETFAYSLPRIGRLFGGRDHTTVLFGIRAHQARVRSQIDEANATGETGVEA